MLNERAMMYSRSHRLYTTWRMVCDRCHGRFNFTCWENEMPAQCVCTGNLMREIPPPAILPPPRITTTSELVILRDIGQIQ